jgi:hypothetical protein
LDSPHSVRDVAVVTGSDSHERSTVSEVPIEHCGPGVWLAIIDGKAGDVPESVERMS